MRLLLDTHALIWWITDPSKLGRRAYEAIENSDNDSFVSAVSAMEVCTKVRLGKLAEAQAIADEFEFALLDNGFLGLHISVEHAQLAGNLIIPHKDPFDRLLIAQAQIEQMHLVSNETLFDQFGVLRIW